jgi:FixJ family two-component response regulator
MTNRPLVAVVDDDESVRESRPDLLREFGFRAQTFASAAEFLASTSLDETHCLLLDIAMPGMTGPELQKELARQGRSIAIVFITANAQESTRSRLLATGAVDCLFKPFTESALLTAVTLALGQRQPTSSPPR